MVTPAAGHRQKVATCIAIVLVIGISVCLRAWPKSSAEGVPASGRHICCDLRSSSGLPLRRYWARSSTSTQAATNTRSAGTGYHHGALSKLWGSTPQLLNFQEECFELPCQCSQGLRPNASSGDLTPDPLCHEPRTYTACSPCDALYGLPLRCAADKPAKNNRGIVVCTPQLLPPQPPATRAEQQLRMLLPPCRNASAWQWMDCAHTQAENTTCRDRYTLCASRPIGRRVQAQVPSRTATGLTQQLAHGKRQLMNRPAPLSPAPHATGKQIKLLLGQPPPKPPSSHPIRPHPAKCDRRGPNWTLGLWTLMQLHVATLATTTFVWLVRQWTVGHAWVALASMLGDEGYSRLMHTCELVKTVVKMVDSAVMASMAAMRAGRIIHMIVCTMTLYLLVCSEC